MALKTGHYSPANHDVHVELWPTIKDEDDDSPTFGEQIADEDNLPEGFVRETEDAGRPYYVLKEGRKVIRHPVTKEAVNVVPGGAVVTQANGIKYSMTPKEFKAFEAAHVPATANVPEPVDSATVPGNGDGEKKDGDPA